jgi:MtN3 and saliva related transmembrane protein
MLSPKINQMLFLSLLEQQFSSDPLITIIGGAAASLTTSSFLPQIIKAYRTKNMEDVSQYLMSFFATGTVLWIIYGIFKNDIVIIAANAIASAFNIVLLYMKFTYGRRSAKLA